MAIHPGKPSHYLAREGLQMLDDLRAVLLRVLGEDIQKVPRSRRLLLKARERLAKLTHVRKDRVTERTSSKACCGALHARERLERCRREFG
jgi:hypothetical protein